MANLNWGIIGTGAIAKTFAHGLTQSKTGKLVAVGSRSQETADAFGDEYNVPNRHGSYDALIGDDQVQAVYISTPHPMHPEWSIKAAEAGKHVLCEKPAALNNALVQAMIQAARENGVLFMEAFMYRCHPQTAKLVELVQSGVIGQVRMIRSSFGFGGGDSINAESRLFNNALGGGGILDVGTYAISGARLVAGAAMGKPFAEPKKVVAAGRVGETGVDEWTAAVLEFDNDIIAQVSTAVRAGLENLIEVIGASGKITVPNPWVADRKNPVTGKILVTAKGETTEYECPAYGTSFALEADVVAEAVAAGKQEAPSPAMTWADTLGNLAVADQWRDAIGVVYEAETPEGSRPARGGTIAKRPDAPMKYGNVEGLDFPVAKFVMGCDNKNTLRDAAPVWDDYFERGGNTFDTAFGYGRQRQVQLGQWIRSRGLDGQIHVICKGAHTPKCYPDDLTEQLMQSIEDFNLDSPLSFYIMHRDNLEVPVGEFIDVLNEHVEAGRIKVFGGSNWTIERFAEANAYAKANGKRPMTVMNNNLSLARMVEPVWGGCVHVSDRTSRQWLTEHNVTNFSWSSQARGYFLPEGQRMKLGAGNFAKWDSADNQARRARAEELAAKKGCSAINIAAAYVISQAFASFALVGPRTIEETATIMPALNVELTPEEVEYLWGEDV
jgi:predicted dehydrogenase/aryl-alcohol dehydrogenase-like predicted oxidoreductase